MTAINSYLVIGRIDKKVQLDPAFLHTVNGKQLEKIYVLFEALFSFHCVFEVANTGRNSDNETLVYNDGQSAILWS